MPDLLLELVSEEIPARMQKRAAEDLRKLVTDALVARGFLYEGAQAFATPRRLALHIAGLPAKGADVREERKGPRVGAPEAAVQGFLKSAGLADIAQAKIEKDPKKGEFYVAVVEKPGRATTEAVAEIVPAVIRHFPWPKSMRWGAASAAPGSLAWVRPLQSILCTFGPETEEPEVVHFAVDGLESGALTRGHRFHAPGPIKVRRFADYVARLEKAKVVLDADRRRQMIRADAKNLAFAQGLELIEDEGLLEEVAGLVEWPVVLMGRFEESFLDIPAEVIRATIRANQKCFVLRQSAIGNRQSEDPTADCRLPTAALAPRFLLVANIEASDGGQAIVAGNERVIRARLSDALHFWKTDRGNLPNVAHYRAAADRLGLDLAKPLDQRMAKLAHLNVVFHEKLGTQGERVERIAALARELAPIVGAGPDLAARAAVLAKADLTTEVVGEFPETQGSMGARYAAMQGEHPSVCAAIKEHYKPQGPGDRVPRDPVSVAVALADKLDTLVGFWAIDEKPTGSKDPYALRRAALGVIRLVVENGIRLPFRQLILQHAPRIYQREALDCRLLTRDESGMFVFPEFWGIARYELFYTDEEGIQHYESNRILFADSEDIWVFDERIWPDEASLVLFGQWNQLDELPNKFKGLSEFEERCFRIWNRLSLTNDLLSFFHDRLKVQLREQGARHDLVDAVLSSSFSPWEKVSPKATDEGPDGGGAGAKVSAALGENSPAAGPSSGRSAATFSQGEKAMAANDDLLLIVRRVEALGRFLDAEDGKNLLAGYRRAANILRAEEKKDGEGAFEGAPDARLLAEPAEKALAEAFDAATRDAATRVAAEDFEGAMTAIAALRPAVDAFFDQVMVNADNMALRANRLKLLAGLRRATRTVADFSKIAG